MLQDEPLERDAVHPLLLRDGRADDAERHVLQFGEMSVAPFRACMQAGDMWQRRWMAAMSGGWTAPRSIAAAVSGRRCPRAWARTAGGKASRSTS